MLQRLSKFARTQSQIRKRKKDREKGFRGFFANLQGLFKKQRKKTEKNVFRVILSNLFRNLLQRLSNLQGLKDREKKKTEKGFQGVFGLFDLFDR